MHISWKSDLSSKVDIENEKVDIENEKVDIENEKANIENEKANIRKRLKDISTAVSEKTIRHVIALFEKYGKDQNFSRSCVEKITGLKSTRASELLKMLLENQIIEPVKGNGKGKYHFL